MLLKRFSIILNFCRCVNLPVTSVNLDTSLVAAAMFVSIFVVPDVTGRGRRRAAASSTCFSFPCYYILPSSGQQEDMT